MTSHGEQLKMSDEEEYEYDYGSDASYNYGSDDGGKEGLGDADDLIEIENSYYEADDAKLESPRKAIELYEKVVELESSRGPDVKWRFKALQNLVTLYYTLGNVSSMVSKYREMLQFMSSVTRNECTDAINAILDALSTATDVVALAEMYEITLAALKTANNERLWFNTNLKLARVYMSSGKFGEVERIIDMLKSSCRNVDGGEDYSKGASLLEVYCLEIQLCSMTHNNHRMRQIYPNTLHLNAAVADPRITAIIREEGAKMHMTEGNWDEAYNEMYEAFRNYQQAGNPRARDCLKYVVLTSMLALSDINPFAAREAKVFADDKEIIAMSDLRLSLETNDLTKFERILNTKQNKIADDPLLMTYIQPLRRKMKEQVLVNIVKPFQKVQLSYLAEELSLTMDEVESLLVEMILDERIVASIDQVKKVLILRTPMDISEPDKMYFENLVAWADMLKDLPSTFDSKFA